MIIDDEGRRLLEEAMREQMETGQQSQQLTGMAHEARRAAQQYVTLITACSLNETSYFVVVYVWARFLLLTKDIEIVCTVQIEFWSCVGRGDVWECAQRVGRSTRTGKASYWYHGSSQRRNLAAWTTVYRSPVHTHTAVYTVRFLIATRKAVGAKWWHNLRLSALSVDFFHKWQTCIIAASRNLAALNFYFA